MLPFNGPLPRLVLPPNHWIKLVAIVLHCLYWKLLEFTKKKNQTWLICTLFQIQIFFFSLPHLHTQKKKTTKKKTKQKKGGYT